MHLATTAGLLTALLAALLMSSGCAKSKYIIKGLRLPPGAVEVDFSETKSNNLTMVASSFNYDGGWDSVVAHFDRILRSAGYRETLSEMDMGSVPGMEGFDTSQWSRMYGKEGSDYVVQVSSNRAMMEAIGAMGGGRGVDMPDLFDESMGEFILSVMRSPSS